MMPRKALDNATNTELMQLLSLRFAQQVAASSGGTSTGSTVPATGTAGDLFLHTPTGRKILLIFDGVNWVPLASVGTITMYVDNTDGTDAIDKGGAVDSGAFKTVQYAVNQCPPVLTGSVTINLNAETFAEDVRLEGKTFLGSAAGMFFDIVGTLTLTQGGNTATGGAAGAGATLPNVTDAGLTANAWNNQLLKFTNGANDGIYRVIDNNTIGQINLVGDVLPAAPINLDTYEIYDWGTTLRSLAAVNFTPQLRLYNINFNATTGESTVGICKCTLYGTRLKITSGATSPSFGYMSTSSGYIELITSLFLQSSNPYMHPVRALYAGEMVLVNTKIVSSSTGPGITGDNNSFVIVYACVIAGGATPSGGNGINAIGACDVPIGASTVDTIIRDFTAGIYAANHGCVTGTANVTYSGNTADEVPTAASYGYID